MKLFLPVYTAGGFRAPYTGSFADAPPGAARLFAHYALHWAVAFMFFGAYLAIMLFARVPTWSYHDPLGCTPGDLEHHCTVYTQVRALVARTPAGG